MTRRLALALSLALVLAGAGGCSLFHGKKASAASLAPVRILKLDSTVLNLADASPAYLRIGVSLGVTSTDAAEDAKVETVARDTIVNLASAQTAATLLTPAGKAALKAAMLAALRKRLPATGVEKVYFDEFLVQN
jgi:flagellar basal body-associated protein FliL